jgi:NADH-quinone oxidoreductase subunit L
MLKPLFMVPALPLLAFLLLVLGGRRWPRAAVAAIGVGLPLVAAVVAAIVAGALFYVPAGQPQEFTQTLWQWMQVGDFAVPISLHLDALSCVMMLVVTGVGALILLYSAEFMQGDEGYGRFFAYMNLFIASMLVLVLADNLLLLYLGWEGVGLCSYLLIGFWYKDPANARAAVKAFIVTRVGDASMAVGLLLLFVNLGTLDIQTVAQRAADQWAPGSALAIAAAALLLGGAVGKSAQLPLQTWLPDAMAGPTPTSALIHAATMVTAGVYLIARTHVLFELAPAVQLLVAVIGAATLLLAGFSALVQTDLKRVLAYSTISQIGYMFLALGVGAWGAAIFHFMTHAFFKSLLFLGAGVVIMAMRDEHDMRKMGGLRRSLPGTFWAMLVGAASLSALPLVTAGFYSKDLILAEAWSSPQGGAWLWAAGVAGALLTALYAFRMVFLVFFGSSSVGRGTAAAHSPPSDGAAALPRPTPPPVVPGPAIGIPLAVLAGLSIVGGFIQVPVIDFLSSVLPAVGEAGGAPIALGLIAGAACLLGILAAYLAFLRYRAWTERVAAVGAMALLRRFWLAGWGFDWLYGALFVHPLVWIARVNRADFIDAFYGSLAWLCRFLNRNLILTQNGQVRWYALGLVAGAVVILAMVILL